MFIIRVADLHVLFCHTIFVWNNSLYFQCRVGSEVKVRVGGDFFYPPNDQSLDMDILLIGGGVGINPLFSILGQFCQMKRVNKDMSGSTTLLYSARTKSELIFTVNRTCRVNGPSWLNSQSFSWMFYLMTVRNGCLLSRISRKLLGQVFRYAGISSHRRKNHSWVCIYFFHEKSFADVIGGRWHVIQMEFIITKHAGRG